MGLVNAVPLVMLSIMELNTLHTDFERIFLLYNRAVFLFIELKIKNYPQRHTWMNNCSLPA